MKLSTIFRKTAEYLDNSKSAALFNSFGVCWALKEVVGSLQLNNAREYFHALFQPDFSDAAWYMRWENGQGESLGDTMLSAQEAKARRVLALLFAAEAAKSEGL